MLQRVLGCVIFMASITLAFAQQQHVAKEAGPRKTYVYAGVQVNQLLRQILNFGGGSNAFFNPYLLTLGVNSAETGWGVNIGHGYTYTTSNDSDANFERETKINDQFFRLGFEKKTMVSPKFMASWGFDLVMDSQKNETSSSNKNNDNFSNEFTSKVAAKGLGPRVALNYQLSEKILIGTECNYYFKSGKNETNTKTIFTSIIFDPFTGQQTAERIEQEDKSSDKFKRFSFNAPAVIYLILKF